MVNRSNNRRDATVMQYFEFEEKYNADVKCIMLALNETMSALFDKDAIPFGYWEYMDRMLVSINYERNKEE